MLCTELFRRGRGGGGIDSSIGDDRPGRVSGCGERGGSDSCGEERPDSGAIDDDMESLRLGLRRNFLMLRMLISGAGFSAACFAPSSDVIESSEKRLDGVREGARSSSMCAGT